MENGKKVISLDTGESYVFVWSGHKKRRDAGVGILIKICDDISFEEPDFSNPRLMALNIQVNGFRIRLVNAYAPTNCDGSDTQKDIFYRMLRKACKKQYQHQKLIVNGDFNATTSVSLKQCYFDGKKLHWTVTFWPLSLPPKGRFSELLDSTAFIGVFKVRWSPNNLQFGNGKMAKTLQSRRWSK